MKTKKITIHNAKIKTVKIFLFGLSVFFFLIGVAGVVNLVELRLSYIWIFLLSTILAAISASLSRFYK